MMTLETITKKTWSEIDDQIKFILGRPNFVCGSIANELREHGHEIERKAETEQAYVILFLLDFYFKHGDNWKKEFTDYVNQKP